MKGLYFIMLSVLCAGLIACIVLGDIVEADTCQKSVVFYSPEGKKLAKVTTVTGCLIIENYTANVPVVVK